MHLFRYTNTRMMLNAITGLYLILNMIDPILILFFETELVRKSLLRYITSMNEEIFLAQAEMYTNASVMHLNIPKYLVVVEHLN